MNPKENGGCRINVLFALVTRVLLIADTPRQPASLSHKDGGLYPLQLMLHFQYLTGVVHVGLIELDRLCCLALEAPAGVSLTDVIVERMLSMHEK